jgi:cytochrome c556
MHRSTRFTVYLGSASLAAFALSLTTLSAGQGGQPPAPAPGTPPKPLVPVAASSVAKNPDPYIGEYVTLTATVESNLSKTGFSVDQDKTKSTGQDVLVIAPTLQKQADANGYVTVIGQLIKFDPAEVEKNFKGYTIDLPADVQAKYKGKPVVLATAVINSGGVDIAKKPIPPMTADDLALQKIMTKLPPAQAALRKALDGKDMNLVKEQATILKTAFTDTEAFWKAKGNTDAMNIATEGKKHADAILINLGLGNLEAAKTSITPLGGTCASCHGKYRDRMDDGTFRIRTGTGG